MDNPIFMVLINLNVIKIFHHSVSIQIVQPKFLVFFRETYLAVDGAPFHVKYHFLALSIC